MLLSRKAEDFGNFINCTELGQKNTFCVIIHLKKTKGKKLREQAQEDMGEIATASWCTSGCYSLAPDSALGVFLCTSHHFSDV